MRLLVIAAVGALLLGGFRLALEEAIDSRVRQEVDKLGLGRTARFASLDIDLPGRLGMRDLNLVDPEDGAVLAALDCLDANLVLDLDGEYPVYLESIIGRGGRVEIRTGTASVVDVPFIRSLIDLVGAILDLIPDGDEDDSSAGPPPPRVQFFDVEAVIWSPNKPVMRYPGIEADIIYSRETGATTVVITPVETGGTLTMIFANGGLQHLGLDGMLVGPALELMAGEGWGDAIASVFAPLGRVDLQVDDIMSDSPSITGELRDADLDAPGVPFPLYVERLVFAVEDEQLKIEDTRVDFPGGSAQVKVTGDLHSLDLSIDIADNAFQRSYLELVPGYEQLGDIQCEDAGSFDLALRLVFGTPGGRVVVPDESRRYAPRISGGGGFHLEHAWLASPRIDVHDLMGRLTIKDDVLRLTDVSATVAHGRLRAEGEVGLADDLFVLEMQAEDIDIEAAHDVIHPGASCGNDFAGSLSGSLHSSGHFDELLDLRADGEFQVLSGKFMETNLITSIFRRASVDGMAPRDDQRLGGLFSINGRRLFLDTIAIDLGALGLTGSGWLDENGRLSLELVLVRNLDGLLGDVLGFIQNNLLVQVEVRGTLNQPDVRTYPVAVVTRSLSQALEFLAETFAGEEDG